MEDGEEEDEEDEDEEEELGAGYLLWFCLFLVDATPLLQLGLSAPRSQGQRRGKKWGPKDRHSGLFPSTQSSSQSSAHTGKVGAAILPHTSSSQRTLEDADLCCACGNY